MTASGSCLFQASKARCETSRAFIVFSREFRLVVARRPKLRNSRAASKHPCRWGQREPLFKVSERTCKLHALPYLLSIRKSPPGCRCVGFRPALHQQSPKAGGTSATLIKRAPAGSCARG